MLPVTIQMSKVTVRTSNRRVFRRCLRKWGFQSSMRMNLERKGAETNINFWFGTAIHFALEDFFGYNKFGDPIKAFQAYYAAFKPEDRPNGADEHYVLGKGMLEYFLEWYPRHNGDHMFETVWLNEKDEVVPPGTEGARPLLEESFLLDLGLKVWVDVDSQEIIKSDRVKASTTYNEDDEEVDIYIDLPDGNKGRIGTYEVMQEAGAIWEGAEVVRKQCVEIPVCYHGTMDRIVQDKYGRWWIMDWKTAKGADTNKLDTDDQISAYMWAAEQWFGRPIHGFVYVQLTKDIAKEPKRLTNGQLSVDKKQKTTYQLIRKTLVKEFGSVAAAPKKYIDFLNHMATLEHPEGDRFIRWDLVTRNKEQKESTFQHVLGEVQLMIDPDLYLFPNPTRDCIWDCPFREHCIMMDKGLSAEAFHLLDAEFEPRGHTQDGNIDPWRVNIPWPDVVGEALGTLLENAIPDEEATLVLILPDEYKDLVEK